METLYFSLKDNNEKVISSQDLYSKMNNKQTGYLIFIRDWIRPNVMQVRGDS